MNAEDRRSSIIQILQEKNKPVKGTELANQLGVSRQVIVQDVALLRAQGSQIMATPQGYVMLKNDKTKLMKTIVSKHHSYSDMNDELQIMIDYGARVIDVVVEHPLYGEIRSILDISYKKELDDFMEKIRTEKAEPLATLTDGVHIHTIEVPNEESYNKIRKVLLEKGFLIED
ncbi:transcriptional regulator of NAD metabolism [Alkaliphilus hydrothermalis]|uniref:Transcriptional regulator of NAD metabolism n=1 Tax=Alkaliphilus hydrothermalis TaxID=1482730 RepID=A0ABS2NP20_9FIRM|nr:transcription repressor NadR [Alkaliphilus hydrothermalis]MBM7614677.1 transcriptional regulator of NAD metabolism [Alkaliphilus hydrothermalis]